MTVSSPQGRAAMVAIDLQVLQVEGFAERGIGRYVAAHAAALGRRGRVAGALLAPELPPPAGLPFDLVAQGVVRWDGVRATRELVAGQRWLVHHVPAPFLHVGASDPSYLVVSPHWARVAAPRAVTLYDLIPLRAPRHYLCAPGSSERYRARARWVGGSAVILAISEHTRCEAIELLDCDPERVVTIGAGVSEFFSAADGADEALFESRLAGWAGRQFVFCVAGSDSRKNTDRLIEAVAMLPEIALVVAGHLTDAWRARLTEAATRARIADRVILLGQVGDELLRACYRRATLTVMPSLAEGSGLPVLEAAACGCAVAASATTALGEVSATVDAQFDPTEVESIAQRLRRLLEDQDLRALVASRQASLAAGATWAAVAQRTEAALDAVVADVGASSGGQRGGDDPGRTTFGSKAAVPPLSVALFGPVAPQGGGLGRYHLEVLKATAPLVETTSVSDHGDAGPDIAGIRHVRSDVVGSSLRPASFDGFVYSVGNSAGHLETLRCALRYPGWMWLHEVRLPALATTALEGYDDAEFADAMERLLARAYPGRSPLAAARRAGRSNLELIHAGVGLAPVIAERVQGLLVNSEAARRLLAVDLLPLAHHPPIHVLPPGFPPVAATTRPVTTGSMNPSPRAEPPLVVTFGVVSGAKCPELLVAAAKVLRFRLSFVGECPAILEQSIREQAAHLGVAGLVEVTGRVADPLWRDWMARATLAVQLREPSSGEMSAASLDALGAGVPLLTNMASVAEYPPKTRRHLRTMTVSALVDEIGALLDSPAEMVEMAQAGRDFAADHPFSALAERLVSLVAR